MAISYPLGRHKQSKLLFANCFHFSLSSAALVRQLLNLMVLREAFVCIDVVFCTLRHNGSALLMGFVVTQWRLCRVFCALR